MKLQYYSVLSCRVVCLGIVVGCFSLYIVPQATVIITKSRSGPVYAGTEFMLTADISLSGVNGDISLDITWRRGNDVVANDTRTTVSVVSGSGDSYTASLTYSPINISDSGQITATVSPSDESMNMIIETVTNAVMLSVQGVGIYIIDFTTI